MTYALLEAAIGAIGLITAMLAIWYVDDNYHEFEKKLSIKIAAATGVFSVMMFTPLIDTRPPSNFLEVGAIYFPSLKIVADAVTLGFLTSGLKDIIEREQDRDEEESEE